MTSYVVRELGVQDLEPDSDFFQTLSRFNLGNITKEDALFIFGRIGLSFDTKVFVIEANGEVVATATSFWRRAFIHQGGAIGYIEEVATRQDKEGHGYGAAAVRACVDYLKSKKCYKILLTCAPQNVAYYEKLGFHKHDEGMRLDIVS